MTALLSSRMTEGFNDTDLEVVVKDTIELAFINGKENITTEGLLESVKKTKSIEKAASTFKTVAKAAWEGVKSVGRSIMSFFGF